MSVAAILIGILMVIILGPLTLIIWVAGVAGVMGYTHPVIALGIILIILVYSGSR